MALLLSRLYSIHMGFAIHTLRALRCMYSNSPQASSDVLSLAARLG